MTAIADWADFNWEFTDDLFSRARVQATHAQRLAAVASPDRSRSVSRSERGCVASAVALTAGAVEDWVTSALLATRVPIPAADPLAWHGALPRWRRLPAIAGSLGRAQDFALSEAQEAFLEYLGAWHAHLTYADSSAETWLCDWFVSLGQIDRRQNVTHVISANLASAVIAGAGQLFGWAHTVTGLPTPDSPEQNHPRDRQASTDARPQLQTA